MPPVWVEGQVVQITHRGGVTVYLTLRDTVVDQSLPVTANTRLLDALATPLVDGAQVVIRAEPAYWTKRGQFNLHATDIRPVGVGELLAQIEQLKRLLAAEGLFAAERKKRLPFLPRVIGLVCGRDSAAEHDVVAGVHRRWPSAQVRIRRAAVQGRTAVEEVTAALAALDGSEEVDVVVIARGGGSVENLLPFSNEALIRAVAAARTPVVSAIGHEEDRPLLDLVADLRASTPTDAARYLVPDHAAEQAGMLQVRQRARAAWRNRLRAERETLTTLRSRPAMSSPAAVVGEQGRHIADLRQRASRATTMRLQQARTELAGLRANARALSPMTTMDRGYALIHDQDGVPLTSVRSLHQDQEVTVVLHDGTASALIAATSPLTTTTSPADTGDDAATPH